MATARLIRYAPAIAASLGGACTLLAIGHNTDFTLGGNPASLTRTGYVELAAFGALYSGSFGVLLSLALEKWSDQAISKRVFTILLGLILGSLCAPLLTVFHLPVDLYELP